MECNKDEAEKCIQFARLTNDREKKLKFLHKAQQLYPTESAKKEIAQLESDGTHGETDEKRGAAATATDDGDGDQCCRNGRHSYSYSPPRDESRHSSPSRRTPPAAIAPSSSSTAAKCDYTEEQAAAVSSVCKLTDYYQILGLTKTATLEQIKKSYKTKALLLHPDRNRAPGSTEAFRLVSDAYQCLSNERTRKNYDTYGTANGLSASSASDEQHRGFRYSRYEPELHPEDLFNFFFNEQSHHMHRQQRTHHRHEYHPAASGGILAYVQFFPIVLMIIMAIFSAPPSDESFFSLDRTQSYVHEHITARSNIRYYVSDEFQRRYVRDRRAVERVEALVEGQHVRRLLEECEQEKRTRKAAVERAKAIGDAGERASKLKDIHSTPLTACGNLKNIPPVRS